MSTQRSDRVAEAIKRVVSDLLLQKRLKDVRIGGLVTVTDVEMSHDLSHATVFVSIYGEEGAQSRTMEGLNSALGFVRSEVGKSVPLRHTPDIHFKLDRSIEHGAKIHALLDEIKRSEQQ